MSQNRHKCLHPKGGVHDTGIPPHLGWWWPAKSEGDMHKNMSILVRWKSIEGHARGVERMLEHDPYCVDILKQTLAIQGAIEKVNEGLLERHTCKPVRRPRFAVTTLRNASGYWRS